MSRFFFNHGGVVAGNLGIFNKGEDMDDRKLLELAAKAVGVNVWTDADGNYYTEGFGIAEQHWNPLTDDGDALRLTLKLRLRIDYVGAQPMVDGVMRSGMDAAESARRSIVRAAAAIGEQMP